MRISWLQLGALLATAGCAPDGADTDTGSAARAAGAAAASPAWDQAPDLGLVLAESRARPAAQGLPAPRPGPRAEEPSPPREPPPERAKVCPSMRDREWSGHHDHRPGEIEELSRRLGVPVDPRKGSIVYRATDPSGAVFIGATFTLTPAAGDGPFYCGADGYPDPALRATTLEGGGAVVYVNLPPRTEVTLHAHVSEARAIEPGEPGE